MNRIHVVVIALMLALPTLAMAQASMPAAEKKEPAQKGRLVFVSTTGLEDVGTLSSSLRHATAAKQSGYLSEVVWLSYGRAVVALDPTVKAVPEEIHKLAQAAKAAGVRLVACGNALDKFGIDPKKLTPQTEVVPNGVVELSRLVAEGYAVIRY